MAAGAVPEHRDGERRFTRRRRSRHRQRDATSRTCSARRRASSCRQARERARTPTTRRPPRSYVEAGATGDVDVQGDRDDRELARERRLVDDNGTPANHGRRLATHVSSVRRHEQQREARPGRDVDVHAPPARSRPACSGTSRSRAASRTAPTSTTTTARTPSASAPGIEIVKAVNARDPLHPTSIERADGAWRPSSPSARPSTFTYLVTNTGNIRLSGEQGDRRRRRRRHARDLVRRLLRGIRQRRHEQRRLARPRRDVAVQGGAAAGEDRRDTSNAATVTGPRADHRPRPSRRATLPATSAARAPRA